MQAKQAFDRNEAGAMHAHEAFGKRFLDRLQRLFAQQVVPLLASGALRPVIDKVFEMKDVRQAHERIESNESFGKVVLLIG